MEKRVLSIRVRPEVHAELQRAAAIGGMNTTEALSAALNLYLGLDDADRLRQCRAAALEQLAIAVTELRRLQGLIGKMSYPEVQSLELDPATLEAALNAVEMAAARIAP